MDYPLRTAKPICQYFYQCGGCETQDVPYTEQLRVKEAWLKSLFGDVVPMWEPIIGSSEEYPAYYRNKIRFGFVRVDGIVHASRHQKGSDEADIPVSQCYLQSPTSDELMNETARIATEFNWSIYDPKSRSGWLKHLLVREAKSTGEFLVGLVTDEGSVEGLSEWTTAMSSIQGVKSVYHCQSWGATNTRFDDTLLWGEPGIIDTIGALKCWISPHSFFQTNGKQIELLYSVATEHAALTGKESLWDLYAGSATIGMYMSQKASKVVSIESSKPNIGDATWNLRENGITNLKLVEGLVEDVVTSAFVAEHGTPDVVVVDPPRAGLHQRFRTILPNLNAQRIVYVSCNPITCLRDVKEITRSGYKVSKAQGVDMFPHTSHCEVVITLAK